MAMAPIIFAPVLRAEKWFSIDLQQRNILDALSAFGGREVKVHPIAPWEALAHLPGGRQFCRDWLYPHLVRKTVRHHGPSLLHVADHGYGHLCRSHQPCVVNCNDLHHFSDPDLRGLTLARWKARVRGMRWADRIITISDHLAGEVRTVLDLPAHRVVALPGGVDTQEFHAFPLEEAAARLPRLASLRANRTLVLHIGSNMRLKNLPTLLRAVALGWKRAHPPLTLVKVGPPLRSSEHGPLLRQLGLAESVLDLGMLAPRDVAAACRLCHVLSFPSLYEGFGRPVVEAQACELPCVLADTAGMREIGGPGAIYHVPSEPESLAHALEQAVFDPEVRSLLLARGKQNAARFSWRRHAEGLVSIYREVLQERGGAWAQ